MKLFDRVINRLVTRGQLTIIYHDGRKVTAGTPDPAFPSLALRFRDARVPFDIMRDPRLGMAEAYIDGRVAIEGGGILEFISLIRANNAWESGRSISRCHCRWRNCIACRIANRSPVTIAWKDGARSANGVACRSNCCWMLPG